MQMDVETVQASPAFASHLQISPKPQVSKYYFKKISGSHIRNGKDDGDHDSRIQPRSPLSRQSLTFNVTPTYHPGAFYEINHDKLTPKSPIHLKSIRVVKVSECTNLDITVNFPSLQALHSFFSSYPAPSTGPELDERFVMSSNHAARILHRRVAEEELEGKVQQDSFWLIKPRLYDFTAPQQAPSQTLHLLLPPAPPVATLGPAANSCLLTTLKCDGAGWGIRHRVRYIGRHHDEAPKEASVDGYDTESSVREVQQPPAMQEVKRSERNCKRKREAEGSSKDKSGNEGKKNNQVQGGSKKSKKGSKKAKKRTVESNDGDPRHGKDRWPAERYAAAEKSLLDIMRSRDALFGAPVMRQVLREEARKHIGDTGLLDHLLKHMAGRVPEGSVHRFRRRHNADGAMEYWLEPAELAEVRRQAGVSDPHWVPPSGWKPGDDVSLVTGDILVKRQVEELTEEVNGIKGRMEQLMCKDNGDFDAERAYNSLKEKYQSAVRANEKLEKQVFCLKDMCANMVQMNGELKKEISSFKEHIADKNDKLEEQITYLSNSFLSFKDQLVMALKIETEHHLELAASEAAPCTALYVGSSDQMIPRIDGTAIQGGQDRPVRNSSFHICKPHGTFLCPSMVSGMTISGGASRSCPAAATPGSGIPRSTSCLSSAGPGLPRSLRAPVEVAPPASGLDEHVMFGALVSTPSSALSTNATAATAKLQLSLPSPRSPLQPQELFGTITAAASGFSPQKLMHFSSLTQHHVDTVSSSRSGCSSLLEGKRVLFDADASRISTMGTDLALATPSCC